MKKKYIILILVLASSLISAQNKDTQIADKLFKKFEFISAAFIPELKIARGTSLNLFVDEKNNELSGTLGSPNIQYEDYIAEDLVLDISRESNSIFLTVQVNEVLDGDVCVGCLP